MLTVSREAIYFDGFLPPEKLPVRMSRHRKTTAQQAVLYANNPQGCWKDYVLQSRLPDDIDLFKIGRAEVMASTTPAFIVPAIMDAVRSCQRHGDTVKLVPGEADMYCAKHATDTGAIIFSSDSDLLAHDLQSGAVALFHDIAKHNDGHIQAAVFTPTAICERLGLEIPMAPTRLAYERLRNKNSNTDALIRRCKSPAADRPDYARFKEQYIYNNTMDTLLVDVEKQTKFRHMDPRVSELILQLAIPDEARTSEPTIFLPVLMENTDRGTAWEPSTQIRQLAYSIFSKSKKGRSLFVSEYRRVQSPVQKGRQVDLLDGEAISLTVANILNVSAKLQGFAETDTELFWLSLCLVLDIQTCTRQGKYSHALHVLSIQREKPARLAARVSWDLVHLTAQLHAGLYSFRILHQMVHSCKASVKSQIDAEFGSFEKLLRGVPALTSYPDAGSTIEFLNKAIDKRIFKHLLKMGLVRAHEASTAHTKRSGATNDKNMSRKKKKADAQPQTKAKSTNPFDALLDE